MKAVAKELVYRLASYSEDEAFEIEKLVKVADGLWSILVREPKDEKENSDSKTDDSEKTNEEV